jgi:hypothetical protein
VNPPSPQVTPKPIESSNAAANKRSGHFNPSFPLPAAGDGSSGRTAGGVAIAIAIGGASISRFAWLDPGGGGGSITGDRIGASMVGDVEVVPTTGRSCSSSASIASADAYRASGSLAIDRATIAAHS